MQDLVRYRAMESFCRQKAVLRPGESWRLLAEAEMWHHKALEEIDSVALAPGASAGESVLQAAKLRAGDATRLAAE